MSQSQAKRINIQLPKDALSRVNLGQSFAEYDKLLLKPDVFVRTPAIEAAEDPARSKCFFVGRRGTGKTAITYYLSNRLPTALQLHPQILGPLDRLTDLELFMDTTQRHFRSLVQSFKRALLDEVLSAWIKRKTITYDELAKATLRERKKIDDRDFDLRLMDIFEDTLLPLKKGKKKIGSNK